MNVTPVHIAYRPILLIARFCLCGADIPVRHVESPRVTGVMEPAHPERVWDLWDRETLPVDFVCVGRTFLSAHVESPRTMWRGRPRPRTRTQLFPST